MSDKKMTTGQFLFCLIGGGLLVCMLGGTMIQGCHDMDRGVTQPLVAGDSRSVADFGTFGVETEENEAEGVKWERRYVVYTLPDWLANGKDSSLYGRFELQHKYEGMGMQGWYSWTGGLGGKDPMGRTMNGSSPWKIEIKDGKITCRAEASLLNPLEESKPFQVRVRVRDETEQWSTSPTVPIHLHGIKRFKKK